ncbi:glycerophosphodiester phosphodiesterase family protein [Microbacterium sp. CFBP9034]|uniref:glycerophosphodiester phosphodiesterase family protein n=1 Tax=Microbacterium sp. CFBP9034 TaxID=3096540 RepID=UPI002A6B6161|nr:glycerophosphodiester phosphodiesterase family protein [Microbacterium sp. CFBP9034]MDY0909838.1 glycerophosphodiester phosphodiesterase family protein [Microbacterium sp. CFBP9034]
MTHPWFEGARTPRVLAHRGLVTPEDAAHGVVENSFAAVAAAHSAGAEYVESDCHLTSDGVVVLFHDDDLSRVTGDPRPVASVSAAELAELMSDRGGLITLEQALDAFSTMRFNFDVKAPGAASAVGTTVAPHGARVLLTSFSDERRLAALEAAASAGRGIRPATSAGTRTIARLLTALAVRSDRLVRRALEGVDALQVPERHGRLRIVTRRLIDAAHRHGVEVHVWTVNDPSDMRRIVALGADGIVTDRADIARRTVQ